MEKTHSIEFSSGKSDSKFFLDFHQFFKYRFIKFFFV